MRGWRSLFFFAVMALPSCVGSPGSDDDDDDDDAGDDDESPATLIEIANLSSLAIEEVTFHNLSAPRDDLCEEEPLRPGHVCDIEAEPGDIGWVSGYPIPDDHNYYQCGGWEWAENLTAVEGETVRIEILDEHLDYTCY